MALPMVGQQMTSLIELSLWGLQIPFPEALAQLGWQALRALLLLVGLVVVPVAVVGVLVEFLQTGPVLTMEKIWPKAEHLNPASGLKRMFSLDNLVELLKSLLKTVLVAVIAWIALKDLLPDLPLLARAKPEAVGSALWHASWTLLAWVTGAFLLVSALDLAWHGMAWHGMAWHGMATLQLHEEDAHEHARHTPGNEGRRRRPASQGPSQAVAAGVGSARR